MRKAPAKTRHDDLRPEYDLAALMKGGVRGKYAKRYRAGTNLVLLSPDVARHFRDDEEVNTALRSLVAIAKRRVRSSR
ncbi:MAG: hypothetical protein NTU88_06120 [Armatimonadetes bacterium]|nr:hypothetical protein [Armatimonadota bacterium]